VTEVVPGEVIADIGQLSGRPDLSVIDARAIGDVEAIVVPPEGLRALLVAEAELGERILRALILRRVALIELGFGGPVLVGTLKSPDVTRLSHFLERNAIPFRVVDPMRIGMPPHCSHAWPRRRVSSHSPFYPTARCEHWRPPALKRKRFQPAGRRALRCGVDRSRKPGRTRADDDHVVRFGAEVRRHSPGPEPAPVCRVH